MLIEFLETHGIQQTEVAAALGMHKTQINRLTKDDANPTRQTIDAILRYLGERLGREVTYAEVFGTPGSGSQRRSA